MAWGILAACAVVLAVQLIQKGSPDIHEPSGWDATRRVTDGIPIEILVDAEEFMTRLEQDIAGAEDCVLIQTMSFEGDRAGGRLTAALKASPARNRKLLVDSYSRFVQSDKFKLLPKYWRNPEVREELESTQTLLSELQASQVQVKLTNPVDPLLIRFMARNHKKMALVDDRIAYLGGINFCDHNFAWHDMMVRIESEEVASFLRRDFSATWYGNNLCTERDFGGLWLALLDGQHNEQSFALVIRAIEESRSTIFVESAYISFPFIEPLRIAHERGVRVVLLTPEHNNKPILKHYLLWEAAKAGFEIRLFTGRMNHTKAILIDDTLLITGTSNFDFVSYKLEQEILAVITDQRVISQFRDRVLVPDLQQSKPFADRESTFGGWGRFAAMKATGVVVAGLNRILARFTDPPAPEWAGRE
jgi:cardiolipin synthase